MGDREIQTKQAEGYLKVHVVDAHGEPFAGPVRGFANGMGWTSEGSSDGDQALVLHRIPLGQTFSVCVSGGPDWKKVSQDCEVLLAGGEERHVTVKVHERAPVFVGRVRGAQGKHLGKMAVRMEVHREGSRPFVMADEVDVDHRFRFLPKGTNGGRVTVWARVGGYWFDQTVEALVPPADANKIHDFGDLKLAIAPVELAGHVCFPDGTPAQGVHLEWAYDWSRTPEETAELAARRASLKPLSRCAVGRLQALGLKPSGRCVTAEDGSFRTLGLKESQEAYFGTQRAHVCGAGTYLLPRDTSGYRTEEESKLTLVHAAKVKGAVAMDGNQQVDIFVDYPDGFRFLVCTAKGPNPEFSCAALYPGQVELTVADAESGAVLGKTPSLSLVPGVQIMVRIDCTQGTEMDAPIAQEPETQTDP